MPYKIESVSTIEGGVKIARVTAEGGSEELSVIAELLVANGLTPWNTIITVAHTSDGAVIAFRENSN
jgi:hypothetical protein